MSKIKTVPKPSDLAYVYFRNKHTQQELIGSLCEIIGIPRSFMANTGNTGIDALTGVILYRHLDRIQKQEVLRMVTSLHSRAAVGALYGKVTDILTQEDWGLWSLSNEELKNKVAFHKAVSDWSAFIGLGANTLNVASLGKDMWAKKNIFTVLKNNLPSFVVWAALVANAETLKTANSEMSRRSSVKMASSPYFSE